VDRACRAKAVQEQFSSSDGQSTDRLDAEYAPHINRDLAVERAERLVAAEDSRKAIDEVSPCSCNGKRLGWCRPRR